MAVRQESKHEVIATLRGRYRAAGRGEKGRLSAEVVLVTGYHARYAQTLLREGVPYRGPRLRRKGRPVSGATPASRRASRIGGHACVEEAGPRRMGQRSCGR